MDAAGQGLAYTIAKWQVLGGTLGTMVARFLAMALQLAILDNAGEWTAWELLYVFLVALLSTLAWAIRTRAKVVRQTAGKWILHTSLRRLAIVMECEDAKDMARQSRASRLAVLAHFTMLEFSVWLLGTDAADLLRAWRKQLGLVV